MDQSSVREESSSNTGSSNSCGPANRRKKTDFEDDDIGRGWSPAAFPYYSVEVAMLGSRNSR